MKVMFVSFLLWIAASPCLSGQGNFIYTNNERTDPTNTVSAFAAGVNGILTPLAGSPYPTGGVGATGATFGSKHILAIPQGFLFAANGGSQNISVFSINPATGTLSTVAGSPFATGESVNPMEPDISLAATPDGRFLITGHNSNGHLNVYRISPTGALTRTVASPFNAGIRLAGMAATPDGRFLAVARLQAGVQMFSIAADGLLSQVPGTPLQIVPSGFPGSVIFSTGVDCNCASTQLFEAKFNNLGRVILGVFDIAPTGMIYQIGGSPFVFAAGANSAALTLSPDGRFLFVTNQDSTSVASFQIGAGGVPTPVIGTPVGIPGAAGPDVLVVNEAGTLLFTANGSTSVGAFQIQPDGSLKGAPGSPFGSGYTGFGLGSLAVYPPKTCCTVPAIVGLSASPNALWPPDRKMRPVTLEYQVVAQCSVETQIGVSGGDPGDSEVIDAHHVLLRAAKGTTYTMTVAATNAQNALSTRSAITVSVPHDQRK